MARLEREVEVRGPWSLATSKAFWEGFAPNARAHQEGAQRLRAVFCAEADWHRAEAEVAAARQGSS